MDAVKAGELLWTPSAERVKQAHLTHYMRWLAERGHRFYSYTELWRWSIDDQEGFWGSLWDYFDIRASQPFAEVLKDSSMPGAERFDGALLDGSRRSSAQARHAPASTRGWTGRPRGRVLAELARGRHRHAG